MTLAQIQSTLNALLWDTGIASLPRWQAWLLQMLRILTATARDIAEGILTLRAMGLVYTTLLSLVPLLAVSFSVLKGFGVHNQVEPMLLSMLEPLGEKGVELTNKIIGFVDNVNVRVLGSLSLVFLFYTVVSLMTKIEQSLNSTWRIRGGRNFIQRITEYLSVVMIGPILIFTARDSDIDQVIGLEAGADDYVAKPVDPMVLLARTRALLRRLGKHDTVADNHSDIVLGGLRISSASQQVWLDGKPVDLTTQEFELLALLAGHAGHVFSRKEIFRTMRGIEYDGLDRSIDGRISKLRRKLGDSASHPVRIKTVWGKGYLLVPDAWGRTE